MRKSWTWSAVRCRRGLLSLCSSCWRNAQGRLWILLLQLVFPSISPCLVSIYGMSLWRCTAYHFLYLVKGLVCRWRWTRVVLWPETTVTFVTFFLFNNYLRTICGPWRFCRRLLPCAASNIRGALCCTYPFPLDDLPVSNIFTSEGSLDCKRLVYTSGLLLLAVPSVQKVLLCPRWSPFACGWLFLPPVGIRDPDFVLQVVVRVLVVFLIGLC